MKTKRFRFLSILTAVTFFLIPAAGVFASLLPSFLRCEYRQDPMGIDTARPRLSWVVESGQRGQKQTAYQVLVASSPDQLKRDLGDLWDSGKMLGDQTIQVEYAGKPLQTRMHCYWKVRVWDRDGKPSRWSEPESWSMGLMKPEDWRARWIGYDAAYQGLPEITKDGMFITTQTLKWVHYPEESENAKIFTIYLRKDIEIPSNQKIQSAQFDLYAFNHCAASVNGVAIGEAMHWEATSHLNATAALRPGKNALALTVNQSDSLSPAVIGKLLIRFNSGENLTVPVDSTWKVSDKAVNGWDKPGFNDGGWTVPKVSKGTAYGTPAENEIARVPVPYLRKDFHVNQKVKRATIFATALGMYEMRLNGERVGHDVLTPGWTEFKKRVQYQTYDVTNQVRTGANVIGAILGDGWYASNLAFKGHRNLYGGKPRLLAQMVVELADGSTQIIATDPTWRAAYGPIRHADILIGCEYDARLAMPGWDMPGFDENIWRPVVVDTRPVVGNGGLIIQAANAEPSRAVEEIQAIKITEPKPGCWTFDLGQNMVGWVRLQVRGSEDQRITVRHGEMLNPDGTLYTSNLRGAPATDFYVLAGNDKEILEPYFTFHGFRYVEVRGLTEKPKLDAVTGVVVHTDMRRTGNFECSQPLVNQLYHNIIWGHKGNYVEVPTDCPQRDERMGWTGDTQFFVPTASYNYDVAPFFTRWLTTMCQDSQLKDGVYPHVVPDLMGDGGSTAWGDAALLCTYNTYRVYGDTRLVDQNFDSMQRYMQWLDTKTTNGISHVGGFGDWVNKGGGALQEVMDTAYHAHLAQIMSEMAQAIGRTEDARHYAQLHDEVKAAFIKTFVQPDGTLTSCSQTGYALAFTMDLIPAELREKAAAKYVDEVKRFDWHLATGFIGTPRLLPGLNAAGRDDVAYRLLLQETYPSWLFQVKNGATTMWERWDGWTPDKGFQTIGMNSFNHYAFGAVGEYLYGGVGGIRAETPGYKTIQIAPVARDGITWAKTRFDSIRGKIVSDWMKKGNKMTMDIVIPPNTTATVYVPAKDASSVRMGFRAASKAKGVTFVRMEKGAAVFSVEAGEYRFRSVAVQ